MSLPDLLSTLNTARRKKNIERYMVALSNVLANMSENFVDLNDEVGDLSEILGGGGPGGQIVRASSGTPTTALRARIVIESPSENNSITIRPYERGAAGNTRPFAIISASEPDLSLQFEMLEPSEDGGLYGLAIRLATDEIGEIIIPTYKQIADMGTPCGWVVTSRIGDEAETLQGMQDIPNFFHDGLDGTVGNEGDMYFEEGSVFISTYESTITDSYWKQIRIISNPESDLLGGSPWYMAPKEITVSNSNGGNSWFYLDPPALAPVVNLFTEGQVDPSNLTMWLGNGVQGQRVVLKWSENVGPPLDSLTLITDLGEGTYPVRDPSGSVTISGGIIFDNRNGDGIGAWLELEFVQGTDYYSSYWKIIGASHPNVVLIGVPRIVPGVQTLAVNFSLARQGITVPIGPTPNVFVDVYEQYMAESTGIDYILDISAGTHDFQRIHIYGSDIQMLANSGTLTVEGEIWLGGVEQTSVTFDNDNARLVMEWNQDVSRWYIIRMSDITLDPGI